MATVLSPQILSSTVLLYSFVIITQFGYGLYFGWQMEAPPAYTLLHWAAQLWIIGWWLRSDSRRHHVEWAYDMGLFLLIAWPIVMPYYLLKTRGLKGLLVIVGFIAVYIGAGIAGVFISVALLF